MSAQRSLTTFDLTCIGVNAIVGSGIFTLPGVIAQGLGPASILAFFLCGLLCVPLALGFAAVATRFEKSGSSYIYGLTAFGDRIGFATGWLSWVTTVVSWAAVAVAFAPFVGKFVPVLGAYEGRPLAVGVILALCVVNVVGVKPSAWLTDGLAVIKLLPLLALLVVGFVFFRGAQLVPFAPQGFAALGPAMFVALFAYQGFEVVAIPASEAKAAPKAIPRAVMLAFLVSLSLYAGIQCVAVMHVPGLAASKTPLVDAAASLGGATFAAVLGLGAMLSIFGFNAGTALCAPRFLSAMAEQGQLPAALARNHPRFGTPHLAVIITSLVTATLVVFLDFRKLVDISNVSVLSQYIVTMAALGRFILRPPAGMQPIKMAGGIVLPALGALMALYLLVQSKREEKIVVAVVVAAGALLYEGIRALRARRGR